MPLVDIAKLLPKEPVNRFEIAYWNVQDGRVRHIRLVYHVNATWAEVCPEDKDRRGAPFVDDWQVFCDDRFEGRNDGWLSPVPFHINRKRWSTELEALRELASARRESVKHCKRRLEEAEHELSETLDHIAALGGPTAPVAVPKRARTGCTCEKQCTTAKEHLAKIRLQPKWIPEGTNE